MVEINSIESFETLLNEFNSKEVLTNFYLLPKEYGDLIHSRNLFYSIQNKNLFVFLKKRTFFKLYYFINELNQLPNLTFIQTPVVLEIVFRGEKYFPLSHVNYWKNVGFKPHLNRDCYYLKNKDILIYHKTSDIEIIEALTENDIVYAKSLIEENLDLYTGDQLNFEELQTYADMDLLYIAYYEGQPSGMFQADFKNGVLWLGHIVVDPNFRGKGIANKLVERFISIGKDRNCNQYQLWVIQDNNTAVNLYKKYDFNYLNRSTCSMLKM
jgi:GNAT superfamily N-acetyltransferase